MYGMSDIWHYELCSPGACGPPELRHDCSENRSPSSTNDTAGPRISSVWASRENSGSVHLGALRTATDSVHAWRVVRLWGLRRFQSLTVEIPRSAFKKRPIFSRRS